MSPGGLAALPKGIRVYVPELPSTDFGDRLRAAERLASAGFPAIPHVAARGLTGPEELDRRLAALAQAGVVELLLIAGSQRSAMGPYASTLPILESGLLEAHGMRRIGVAGHPEGHPDVPVATLNSALAAKAALAARGELELYVVTQFAFEPYPYIAWERASRAQASGLPVIAGIPGLSSHARLLRFAVACGVGPSLRRLRKQRGLLRLAGRAYSPDATVAGIASAMLDDPDARFDGLHLFPFGAVERTVDWLAALAAGADTPLRPAARRERSG